MIESSFLSPSLECDFFKESNGFMPDLTLFGINEYPDTGSGDLSPYSNEFSSSSDDLMLTEFNFDTDYEFTKDFVTQVYQETAAGFSDLDYLYKDSPKKSSSNLTRASSPGPSKNKHRNSSEYFQSFKLWSEMSETEQLETLHALSEIVTSHMCIREQTEVIKILDPSAIISPDVKEFVLDCSSLDDIKLERIKDFLRKQPDSKKLPMSTNTYSSPKGSKKVNNSSKLLSRKSNSLPYSRTKRKQKEDYTSVHSREEKKQKLKTKKQEKKLKLKREQQTEKEQMSGFFVYEKKMKIENLQEDDEDINILE